MGDDAISANTSGDDAVAELDAGYRKLAVQTIVRAEPAQIFSLISDPVRHAELDGSRTVGRVVTGSAPLHLGDEFSVAMKQCHVRYRVTNVVTAWESNRLLEWGRPRGHRWRWELVEVAPGQTQV